MNESAPLLGTFCFAFGGLCGALFAMPLRRVKGWAYETYWLVYAVAGMVALPLALSLAFVPDLFGVYSSVPPKVVVRCALFGMMWGVGGLTWGLMIRYLGIGLGLAIGCGICSSVGTLVPPIASGHAADLVKDAHAVLTLCGVVATLVGIAFVGVAGHRKSRELTGEAARKAVAEFDFKKGIWIAIFSGLMSAGMNFGLQGGIDLESAALAAGTASRWRGLPVQSLVLGGGFLVNAAWCIGKGVRQGSLGELRSGGANWLFAALAGIVWAMSATMMKVGEPLMGDMRYISFAVIMSSTVFFSTLFGIFSGEWKGTSAKTKAFLAVGIIILLSAFSVISMGKAT